MWKGPDMKKREINWDVQPLGKMPDKVLAQELGVTRRAVGLAVEE